MLYGQGACGDMLCSLLPKNIILSLGKRHLAVRYEFPDVPKARKILLGSYFFF